MSAARVAVVLPDLAVGGLQGMAVDLAGALDRSRFEPHFYTFDGQGPLAERVAALGLAHTHHPRQAGVDRAYAAGLAERFVSDGMDLVHCHNVTAMFHGSRAARRAGGLPVLFTEHDREMPAPWKHRLLHRWLIRSVHSVAVVSASLAEDLMRYEGFPRDRTGSLVNGIPDPAKGAPRDRAEARARLGWDERPVVLAVGSLTEVKNHAALIDAWAEVADGSARLAIAGEGPLQGELAARAAAAPSGTVELLGRRDDVATLLTACDVYTLPSHREGLSLSLVEAHAMARASVAFDVGGNAEVIVDGETGRLAPYPDMGACLGAIQELLGDEPQAARLGAAARERFLDRFTHDRMVAAYASLYDELLAARAA
jgi:glycosyltransferase involved in cell wall biosynthesis